MLWIFRKIIERLQTLLIADAALGLEAEFLVRQADRKAELLQKAQEYEEQGLEDVADELRGQALGLSIETPVSSVLPGIAELNGEPNECRDLRSWKRHQNLHRRFPAANGAKDQEGQEEGENQSPLTSGF